MSAREYHNARFDVLATWPTTIDPFAIGLTYQSLEKVLLLLSGLNATAGSNRYTHAHPFLSLHYGVANLLRPDDDSWEWAGWRIPLKTW